MDHLDSFIDMLKAERGLSENTALSYRSDLKDFLEHNSNVTKTTKEGIKKYLQSLYKKGISASSLSRKISSLKQFFGFLQIENIIKENPALLIEHPKHSKKIPKYLIEPEVDLLLKNAKKDKTPAGLKFYCMLELLYATGLRVSELVSLPISTVQKKYNKNGFYKIDDFLIVTGKGKKERLAPVNKSAKSVLKEYLNIREALLGKNKSNWLFTTKVSFPKTKKFSGKIKIKKDSHTSRQQFALLLKNLATKSGIDSEKVSPHIIRHSFATHLLNRGADLRILQELLGHSDISTTQIYTHVLDSKLKKIVNQLHPLAKRSGSEEG